MRSCFPFAHCYTSCFETECWDILCSIKKEIPVNFRLLITLGKHLLLSAHGEVLLFHIFSECTVQSQHAIFK